MSDLRQQIENLVKKSVITRTWEKISKVTYKLTSIVEDPLLWQKLLPCDKVQLQGDGDKSQAVHQKALGLRVALLSRSLNDPENITQADLEPLKSAIQDEGIPKVLFDRYLEGSMLMSSVDIRVPSQNYTNVHYSFLDTRAKGVVTELYDSGEGWFGSVTRYESSPIGYHFDLTSPAAIDSQLGTYPLHIGDEVSFNISRERCVQAGTLQVTKYNSCLKEGFMTQYLKWLLSSEKEPLQCLMKLLLWPVPFECALAKKEIYGHFWVKMLTVCHICTSSVELALFPKGKYQVLKIVSNSVFFQNVIHFLEGSEESIDFEQSLDLVVSLLCTVLTAKLDNGQSILAGPLRDATSLLQAGNRANLLQMLMMSLLDIHYSPSMVSIASPQVWKSFSTTPSSHELQEVVKDFENGNPPHLPSVKDKYSSAADYGHTYFSLLRADCYYPLCQKIAKLKKKKERERLPSGCYQMTFMGLVPAVFNPMLFGFKFESHCDGGQGDEMYYLTKGNLLCLSTDGQFDGKFVWGTVDSVKDVTFEKNVTWNLKKGTVYLQMCSDLNCLSDEKCIDLLRTSNNIIAVESSAYFRAYKPVLDALTRLDLKSINFLHTLLDPAGISKTASDLLTSEVSPDTLFKPDKCDGVRRMSVQDLLAFLSNADPQLLCLDPSQVKAVCQSLEYPISVIQGPPGTGKTYVGVKLMQLFLSLSCLPEDAPIVIMAHKNRVLDHFLHRCMQFCSNIVRIGHWSEGYEYLNDLLLHRKAKESEREKEYKQCLLALHKRIQSITAELKMKQKLTFENSIENLPQKYLLSLLSEQQQQLLSKRLDKKYLTFLKDGKAPIDPVDDELRRSLLCAWERWTKEVCEDETTLDTGKAQTDTQDDNDGDDDDGDDDDGDDRRNWNEERKLDYDVQNGRIQPDIAICIPPITNFAGQNNVDGSDAWKLSREQKKSIIIDSVRRSCVSIMKTFRSYVEQHEELLEKYQFEQKQSQLHVLRHTRIVAMTTTGAAINQHLLNLLKVQVMFVEEAAEVLESNLLATLTPHVKHLILIGDHEQLKPWVVYSESKNLNFDKSLFQRLIETGFQHTMLQMQSRMKPELVQLFSAQYAGSNDSIHSNDEIVSQYKTPSCMTTPLFWWSHEKNETKCKSSRINELEVKMVVSLCLWLCSHKGQERACDDIAIITPYRAQVNHIRSALNNKHNSLLQSNGSSAVDLLQPKVYTIDEYQGHDAGIVILSLVRGNKKNEVGFLKDQRRQVVAVSRQKCGLYLVGNASFLYSASPKIWRPIIELCKRDCRLGSAVEVKIEQCTHMCSSPEELEDLVFKNMESKNVFKPPGRQYSSPTSLPWLPDYSGEHWDKDVDEQLFLKLVQTQAPSKWAKLGRSLKLDEHIIQRLDNRNEDIDEKFVQMMHEWKRHNKCATYKRLCQGLIECELFDAVSVVPDFSSK